MYQFRYLFVAALFLLPTLVFAEMDPRCLAVCFATCHECNYCQYQCNKDLTPHVITYSDEDTFCEINCEQVIEGRLY